MFEKPTPHLHKFFKDTDRQAISNSFVAFLFTQTGPIAILLSAGYLGGLTQQEMIAWLFAGYGLGGIITIILSLLYRQPIPTGWSLPAAALVGASLQHASFPEVIGAYIVTGIIITIVALSGITKKGMEFIPIPIVMGMIAGVFLPFCLKIVTTFLVDPWLSVVTIGAFFLLSSVFFRKLRINFIPPILFSTIVGILYIILRKQFIIVPIEFAFTQPIIFVPQFNLNTLIELVFPLTISVLGIQNMQGIAILKAEGYKPPVNIMTLSCGIGTILYGFLGSVPNCIMGPVSAIINSSGRKESRYTGSIYFGFFLILSGIFAPVTIGLALMAPTSLIALLGGLAMFRVLLDSFQNAFKGSFAVGALIAFMVTISNITFLNVGSTFWGLIAGCIISYVMESQDFKRHIKQIKSSVG